MAFTNFWLNSSMTPINDPDNPAIVKNLTLNEKIILAAKEASRRHAELTACFKESLKPNDLASFKFQDMGQATLTEHLLYEIFAKSNPAANHAIHKYYKTTLESTAQMSILIGEFIWKNFNDRCKEHTSLENLESYRRKLAEEMAPVEKLLADFWYREKVVAVWAELNRIYFSVTGVLDNAVSLITLCGFRQAMIPLIKNSHLHPHIIDYVAYERLKAETTVCDIVAQGYCKLTSDDTLLCSPVFRNECVVSVSFDFLINGWLSGVCKRVAGIIDPSCRYSVTVQEMDMLSRYNDLLNGESNLDRNLFTLFGDDWRRNEPFTSLVRDFVLAQANFCKQMHKLRNPSVVEDDTPETLNVVHADQILDSIKNVEKVVDAMRVENQHGIEKVVGGMTAVAEGNYNLQSENEELRQMASSGFLDFVRSVKPDDFRSFVYILALGDRAKAAKALGLPQRRFYEQVDSWKVRGGPFKKMSALVRCRKTALTKGTIPLGNQMQSGEGKDANENPKTVAAVLEQIQSGNLDQRDYPKVLEGILSALVQMNTKNWQAIQKEVMEDIREELAQ